MILSRRRLVAGIGAITLELLCSACSRNASYQRYEAAPIAGRSPAGAATSAAAFHARRLDAPALDAFMRAVGASPADSGWTPHRMAVAALYQRADVVAARSAVAAARAAEATAGVRPEASASGSVEHAAQADEGKQSPWIIALTTGLVFETGGKRDARMARARAGTLGARLRLEFTAWGIAQEAVRAATTLVAATNELRDAGAEATALREVLTLLRARYAEGRISLGDIAQAESDVQAASLAAVQARQARTEASAALARAVAVPMSEVDRLELHVDAARGCGGEVASAGQHSAADSLYTLALQRRFDLGASLADYAVAEAELRTEIARQYPDVAVGPGVSWDQGVLRWVIALGTPALPRARNRGPIAEALARRDVQAHRFAVVQDSVLAAVDAAVAACRAVGEELLAADSARSALQRAVTVADAAYARGENGRTEVALARLALLRAARAARQAADRQALASVALETAAGVWLSRSPLRWPDLTRNDTPPERVTGGQP